MGGIGLVGHLDAWRSRVRNPIGAELGRIVGVLAREFIGEDIGDDPAGFEPEDDLGTMGGIGVLEREEFPGVDAGENVEKLLAKLLRRGVGDVVSAEPEEPSIDVCLSKDDTNFEALRGRPQEASLGGAWTGSGGSGVSSGYRSDRRANNSGLSGMY